MEIETFRKKKEKDKKETIKFLSDLSVIEWKSARIPLEFLLKMQAGQLHFKMISLKRILFNE